jgi:UDP-N-acetylmuramate--alanine ligase
LHSLGSLEQSGVEINYNLKDFRVEADTDLIVYSNAWPKNYPDIIKTAHESGIRILSYPEALGEVTRRYQTVAIAGTHGKTTTTAMLLHILTEMGLSPTGIVGSNLTASKTNFVAGESNLLVIEADEYMKAFLNHLPAIVGVTNIDHDHHDIYPTIEEMKETFKLLGEKLPEIGTLVISALDQNSWETFEDLTRNVVDYSTIDMTDVVLPVIGSFNVQNAQLAIAIASLLGVTEVDAKKALQSFKGTWRRQELKGETKHGVVVYDDYAHHPTEVAASLQAFKDHFSEKNITVIFQPHLYSRTRKLVDEFVSVFQNNPVDQLIVLPVYAAREISDNSVSGKVLKDKIKVNYGGTVVYAEKFDKVIEQISGDTEIVITMGAGSVTKLSDELVKT